MRYILDSYGYVEEVTFGGYIKCNNKSCTEYTGAIPSGYSSLEDWNENANIRAYKIVDGNLVYDPNKDAELQVKCEQEAEKNRLVTHGELDNALSSFSVEVSNKDEIAGILPIRTEDGEVIYIDDASSHPVEKIVITSKETIETLNLYISTSNILPNEAVSGIQSGVIYRVNEDKSIELYGGLTNNVRVTISGSETNVVPLFIFKAGVTYYINKVSDIVNLNLYTNNGTDRMLVYTGLGGASITFEEDTPITHAEINVPCDNLVTEDDKSILTESGVSLLTENSTTSVDETIYLMILVGSVAKEYEKCDYTIVPIDLNGHSAQLNDVIEIEGGVIILGGGGINLIDMPCTYYEKTTIYADKKTYLEVDYKKSSFETVTKSGKGALNLRNTADGYGSIFNLTIKDLDGGYVYSLETSDGDEQSEQYKIDLKEYVNEEVDVVIEKGQVGVYQNNVLLGYLDNIYIRTYSPRTYIELLDCTNRMTCEYMVESDFSIYCTRVEKDASIKIVEDMIKLEVSRASGVEGELRSSITVEADKIEQIVESVGNSSGKVTPASIVAAINDTGSSVKISADKVDLEGTVFPTIQNSAGTCVIDTLFENSSGDGIEYTAEAFHVFNGSIVVDPNLSLYGLQVNDTSGNEVIRTANTFVSIGKTSGEVRLYGTIKINGTTFDGVARFG